MVDRVIEELQQRISLGVLVPGERLSTEDQLAAQLGVSRTTLREAVGVLTHAGLIDVRQGDGSYVKAAPARDEPLGHRLAAARRTGDDLDRMRESLAARDPALVADTAPLHHDLVAAIARRDVNAAIETTRQLLEADGL